MKKLLMIAVLLGTMWASTAEAFSLPFNDLASGTDVLDSYKALWGVVFTPGLYVIDEGAYPFEDPNKGAMSSSGTVVRMSILGGTNMLSFYYQGSAELKAYDLNGNLVFTDTDLLWLDSSWLHYGAIFGTTVYQVDFITSLNTFLIDPITNEGFVVPEPTTLFLLGIGIIGMVTIRSRKIK